MDKPETAPLAPFPPGATYEPSLDRLMRLAAWAGAIRGDGTPVNFTSILVGAILVEDETGAWFTRYARETGERAEAIADLVQTSEAMRPRVEEQAAAGTLPEAREFYSSSVRDILGSALRLATRDGAEPRPLGTRHLLAALAFRLSDYHRRQLIGWGVDIAVWQRSTLDFLQRAFPSEDSTWVSLALEQAEAPPTEPPPAGTIFQSFAAEAPVPPVSAGPDVLIARFTADDPTSATDLMDVRQEARAFARLAAGRAIRPPLSIGVFGEWGSGKTFFMKLMHEHVARISRDADSDGPFHGNIVQIRFNAWHYVESNLWASLVDYIFTELDRWLKERPENPNETVDLLFDHLSTSRTLRLEAMDELVLRRRQRQEAEENLKTVRARFETALARQAVATAGEFWTAVGTTMGKDRETRETIDRAGRALGVPELSASARQLSEVLQETATQAGRARTLGRSAVAMLGRPRWLAALALILVAAPVAVVWFRDILGRTEVLSWLKEVNAAVLGLSSVMASVAGFAGTALKRTATALDTLEGFRATLETAIAERTEEFSKNSNEAALLTDAEREAARLRSDVEQAERRLADADRRAADAARDFQGATARGRLNAFIRDKVVSGDYAKHLGIIATIRKDFGQLAQLMADVDRDRELAEEYERARLDYARRVEELIARSGDVLTDEEIAALRASTTFDAESLRLFERIILYIDDLDRCPPEKVVEVLQAIHLLLCFPLFVVVVAVDARWVSRSLKEVYPELLAETVIIPGTGATAPARPGAPAGEARHDATDRRTAPNNSDRERAASSQDYLEKIFQLPYWVRAMDADACRTYIRGIVAAESTAHAARSAVSPEPAPSAPLSQPSIEQTAAATEATPLMGVESLPPEATPQPDTADGSSLEREARTMALTSHEAAFMAELAPHAGGTPRRGLRFVNVYRLIRTSLPLHEHETLVGDKGEQTAYRALLAQLAIVTGAPGIASVYFDHLAALAADNLSENNEKKGLVDLIAALGEDTRITAGTEAAPLLGALQALHDSVAPQGLGNDPALLATLHNTASVARRYSFTARPH
ncbi:P-loop NTPase fold protein [Geobacter sulfurreducens]|uniref:P-loop NTPase fold protein n=1 Tax=Geobacter sulfurreducens TaxID=35554 RepID=UPI000DBB2982|nr:P-loop NTPase fold protein [Geobacter sulfurreducens]BBA69245.1 hypothetical protein YM18_0697 [Geobacter sulfurreducens]